MPKSPASPIGLDAIGRPGPKDKLTLLDKQDRSVLAEGRNYGVGFAFANRKGLEIELIMPISPCKDYLNDVVYSESTGKDYQAWGLKTSKKGIFGDGSGKLVVGECHYKGGKVYPKYDKEVEYLDKNSRLVQDFLQAFESKMVAAGHPPIDPSVVHKLEPNRHLFIMDLIWCRSTFMISLYSMMIRVCIEGSYGVKGPSEPLEFLKKAETTDQAYLKQAMPKIERIMGGEVPVQNMTDLSPHNIGIVSYQFPDKK